MNQILFFFSVVASASFLIGSIPTGYLVAKAKGVDIRKHGSGNIGATNVFRTLGKPLGFSFFSPMPSKATPRSGWPRRATRRSDPGRASWRRSP